MKAIKISFQPQVPNKSLVGRSATTVTDEEGFYSMYCSPGKYIFGNAFPHETVDREIVVRKGQVKNNGDLQAYKSGALYIKIS